MYGCSGWNCVRADAHNLRSLVYTLGWREYRRRDGYRARNGIGRAVGLARLPVRVKSLHLDRGDCIQA